MATTYVNGKPIETAVFNGVDLDKIYFNSKLVFHKSLSLELPQGVTEINLQEFILASSPGTYEAFTITNNLVQPRVVTGDLTGYDVTFINNSEIQGTSINGDAFEATTLVTLINNGWIRGAGGRGGKGGKGGDNTVVESRSQSNGSFWKDRRNLTPSNTSLIEIYDKSKLVARVHRPYLEWTGPISGNNGRKYTRGNQSGPIYPGGLRGFSWNSTWSETVNRVGGAGGVGGYGQSFDINISYGEPGYESTPVGGNSGGAGGSGGNWGIPGAPGSIGVNGEDGEPGKIAGFAVLGLDKLTVGSITGNTDGATIASADRDTPVVPPVKIALFR